jgi:hypothetical protein
MKALKAMALRIFNGLKRVKSESMNVQSPPPAAKKEATSYTRRQQRHKR